MQHAGLESTQHLQHFGGILFLSRFEAFEALGCGLVVWGGHTMLRCLSQNSQNAMPKRAPYKHYSTHLNLPIEVTIASASCQAVSAGSFLTFLPLTPPYSFCKLAASLWRTLPRMSGPSEPSLGGISTTPWPLRFLALHQLFISRFHQHPGPHPAPVHHAVIITSPWRFAHLVAATFFWDRRQHLVKITVTWTAMRHRCGRSHWPPRQRARRCADAWRTVSAWSQPASGDQTPAGILFWFLFFSNVWQLYKHSHSTTAPYPGMFVL